MRAKRAGELFIIAIILVLLVGISGLVFMTFLSGSALTGHTIVMAKENNDAFQKGKNRPAASVDLHKAWVAGDRRAGD